MVLASRMQDEEQSNLQQSSALRAPNGLQGSSGICNQKEPGQQGMQRKRSRLVASLLFAQLWNDMTVNDVGSREILWHLAWCTAITAEPHMQTHAHAHVHGQDW